MTEKVINLNIKKKNSFSGVKIIQTPAEKKCYNLKLI